MKNRYSKTTILMYVFYTLLTCVLCVGCSENNFNIENKEVMENKNQSIGMSYADSTTTGCESGILGYNMNGLLNKTVKFKNGNIAKVVGGDIHSLLLEWSNGNVSGFGDCNNIVEILTDSCVDNAR